MAVVVRSYPSTCTKSNERDKHLASSCRHTQLSLLKHHLIPAPSSLPSLLYKTAVCTTLHSSHIYPSLFPLTLSLSPLPQLHSLRSVSIISQLSRISRVRMQQLRSTLMLLLHLRLRVCACVHVCACVYGGGTLDKLPHTWLTPPPPLHACKLSVSILALRTHHRLLSPWSI